MVVGGEGGVSPDIVKYLGRNLERKRERHTRLDFIFLF